MRAEEREELAADARPLEAFGVAGAGEVRCPVGEDGETRQRAVRARVVGEVGNRKRRAITLGAGVVHPHEPVGFGEGQLAEDDGADQREDGDRGADAEAERGDGGDGEAGMAAMEPQRVQQLEHAAV